MRVRFGERGAETSWADLAREMGIGRERPWSWEVEGRFPGRSKLAAHLAKLARVRAEGADAMRLAEWVELGPDDKPPFDEPANPNDALDPRRTTPMGSDLEQRTPSLGINVTQIPIVDPEVAIERAIEDVRAGRSEPAVAKLRAAQALLVALRAARNAGLAGVLVAGTYGGLAPDMQGNAKIRREEITKWAEVELLREEGRRRHRKTGTSGR